MSVYDDGKRRTENNLNNTSPDLGHGSGLIGGAGR
jgi:hypothetical protein